MTYIFNPLTNQLDISSSASTGEGGSNGFTWQAVAGTSQSAQANYGYFCQNAALTQITLPTTAAMGTTIEVVAQGSGGFQILQNAGQSISFSSCTTTVGIAGSASSSMINDALRLVCVTANTNWIVISSIGNFIIN
jgi:hypothetical protein